LGKFASFTLTKAQGLLYRTQPLTVPRKCMLKTWIDLEGNLIPVTESHNEWAVKRGHELESLLDGGWVRVQSVPPPYPLIDLKVRLNALHAVAVGQLFENRHEQILVEVGGIVLTFGDGEEALEHVLGVE
jgi:hypothetical protein